MTTKTLMVQGTGSGVGKSLITAAFCRWFFLKGLKVAPFKAQNMSLNSYVTDEGGEMGRAQVYQAEACGLKPHVAMNPILLKPSGDNMSQVIVMGKPLMNRNAKDYYAQKPRLTKEVKAALDFLRDQHDLIILEGAGSPAEINLREQDLVNMAMAEMADAPVVIVGDIDRGGVFAWMKGTYDLLTPDEQDRVKGFIINKFRGDIELLKPGIVMFEEMVGKPVLGTIPFYRDLFVDEEDAIPTLNNPSNNGARCSMDIAIIRLPRISNFTDFSPLVHDPEISVRYVWEPHQVGNPDMLIIPGTKNTIDDLQFLKAQGLDVSISECHRKGSVILGICGGFQMLGNVVHDPDNLESKQSDILGLKLLNMESTLVEEKLTSQVSGTTLASPVFSAGLDFNGYEIHMGRSKFFAEQIPLFANGNEEDCDRLGITSPDGKIIGTYLHGLFDSDKLRKAMLAHVRKSRDLPEPGENFDYQVFRKKQLDRLADVVGDSLDMERIQNIIEKRL